MNRRLFAIVFVAISLGAEAYAYELGTHARLTQKAYERSVLGNPEIGQALLKDLGVESTPNPFGDRYYDVAGADANERGVFDEFELKHAPSGTQPLSIQGWLLRGAIREDDWTGIDVLGCRIIAPNPQDDPYPNVPDRPKNHFYDPYHQRPLTVLGVPLGEKAPDWALGARDAFIRPLAPHPDRRNHFTLLDAREALYRALTGRDTDGNEVAKTKAERNAYWATTFRALCDVVHLVQDRGQPQPTCQPKRKAMTLRSPT